MLSSGSSFHHISTSDTSHDNAGAVFAHSKLIDRPSVNFVTMMNKGLEYIETCWLFNTDAKQEVLLRIPSP
uniref:hypothetical protein n=1 Tax=Candidatus Doolittlea endobia TaxID=1778262 RepID=UPI0022B2267C|nr:hypothetical protein [Candidatus Doolittlea endobia]